MNLVSLVNLVIFGESGDYGASGESGDSNEFGDSGDSGESGNSGEYGDSGESGAYLIFGKISENKIYTKKHVHKRCQLSNYYTEKYQFCVHSWKIYTGQEKIYTSTGSGAGDKYEV